VYRKLIFIFSIMVCVFTIFADCLTMPITAAESLNLNVFAPPVLKEVLVDLQNEYERNHPDIKIVYKFAPPGQLLSQIKQGAVPDIFISAANKQIDALAADDLIIPATRINITSNQMVLIVAKNSSLGLTSFKDLTKDTVKVYGIADATSAPVGQYGIEVLQSTGIWDAVKNKAFITPDGCSIVPLVEQGKVQAGIVFTTNAATSDNVQIVAVAPDGSHEPIVFPGVVLRNAGNPDLASDFLSFITADGQKNIFKKNGFVPVN